MLKHGIDYGAIFLDQTGHGAIFGDDGYFVPSTNINEASDAVEEYFNAVVGDGGIDRSTGRDDSFINTLVLHHGVVVVHTFEEGTLTVISRNRQCRLNEQQIGSIEEMFGLEIEDTVNWQSTVYGTPVRISASVVLYNQRSYGERPSIAHFRKAKPAPVQKDNDETEYDNWLKANLKGGPGLASVSDSIIDKLLDYPAENE